MLIPLPFITALICVVILGVVLSARTIPTASRMLFAALFALGAAESVLVGLRFGYGVEGLIGVQRLLPLLTGPLLFLAFKAMQVPRILPSLALHLTIALILAILSTLFRDAADLLIGLSYILYGILLLRLYRSGPDALTRVRLNATTRMRWWMLSALVMLAIIFIFDLAIALAFALSAEGAITPLIVIAFLVSLAVTLFVIFKMPSAQTAPEAPQDDTLIEQIASTLAETQLYRDPELTLARLARRMGQPARQISRAVNAATGSSVSNYINSWRIEDAAQLLRDSDQKIDDVAYACGFMSRSNFYREFGRVHDQSPSAYRKHAGSV